MIHDLSYSTVTAEAPGMMVIEAQPPLGKSSESEQPIITAKLLTRSDKRPLSHCHAAWQTAVILI